jgi:hypothetical protein
MKGGSSCGESCIEDQRKEEDGVEEPMEASCVLSGNR